MFKANLFICIIMGHATSEPIHLGIILSDYCIDLTTYTTSVLLTNQLLLYDNL